MRGAQLEECVELTEVADLEDISDFLSAGPMGFDLFGGIWVNKRYFCFPCNLEFQIL